MSKIFLHTMKGVIFLVLCFVFINAKSQEIEDEDFLYRVGVRLIDSGDCAKGVEILTNKAIEYRYKPAMLYLAGLYEEGKCVERSYKKAFEWYYKAARDLGGDAKAQYKVGRFYDKGLGVEQSDEEAFKWYSLSAEQGYSTAIYEVAKSYLQGKGVEKNERLGIEWLQKAKQEGVEDIDKIFKFLDIKEK